MLLFFFEKIIRFGCLYVFNLFYCFYRYFWELLSHFTTSDLEREKLLEFCSPEGQDELYSYCHRPRRTIVEILGDFPQTTQNIDLNYLYDLIQPLQPRAFSIASSQRVDASQLQLLMAVVRYKSKLVKPREGVCSTWLSRLNPKVDTSVKVPVWVKKGTISFPSNNNNCPVIMVGPGTGVAPFRNFIQERVSNNIGGNVLFFGCRNKAADFLCEREWQGYVDRGLLKLFVAFSRDQEDKQYVQHLIEEKAALVWDLVHHSGAYFYVAG